MRVFARCCLLALLLPAPGAHAASLYEARTIVTGMDLRTRPAGLVQTLGQVLAKVAGKPALADDARLASTDPVPLLQSLAYLDRMSDLPKHDEQGTRDRPYNLVVRFQPQAIDDLLRAWHQAPWPEPRPVLGIDITITPQLGPPVPLRADTDADERHRGALLAAADRYGLEVVLPATIAPGPVPQQGPVLHGTLAWSDAEFGWVGQWRLAWHGQDHAWGLKGVSFDAAYRNALGGASSVLSGHGTPP